MGGYAAYGTLVQIGDGGTPVENFTTIAEVVNITGPSEVVATIDTTSHSSPNARREFIASLTDNGEVALELNYKPADATHVLLRTVLAARLPRNFKMIFPDGSNTTASFAAYVTGFERSAPVEDKLAATVTLKVNGVITWS